MTNDQQSGGELRQDGGGFPTCFDIVSLALRDVVSSVCVCAHGAGVFSHVAR